MRIEASNRDNTLRMCYCAFKGPNGGLNKVAIEHCCCGAIGEARATYTTVHIYTHISH